MMKKIKTFMMVMVLSVMCVLPSTVFAAENALPRNNMTIINGDETIVPMYNVVCGGLSYHRMVSSGLGVVYLSNGSAYINGGSAWQCSNCNLVMVTQGDIIMGSMTSIGKWAVVMYGGRINKNGVIISGPSSYGSTSSTTLSGYKFFLA